MSWLDDVLRLIGRLCVFAFAGLLTFFVAGMLLKPLFPLGLPAGPERLLVIGFVSAFAALLGHVAVVLLFERGDWAVAGLAPASWRPLPLALSLLAGLLVVLVPAGALVLSGHVAIVEGEAGAWAPAAFDALLWLAAPALFEELLARGYVFGEFERRANAVVAIAVTSLGFGLLHWWNPGATPLTIAAVVIAGVFLGTVRFVTGSVAAAFVAHLAVNWAQGAVLHAPVSGLEFLPTPGYRLVAGPPAWLTGGAWGLEAGAATAAMLLVVTFLFLAAARRRASPIPNKYPRPRA